jgi:hypothetical protein
MKYFLLVMLIVSSLAFAQAGNDSGSLEFSWSVPAERENGQALAVSDIGGYELRCKQKTDSEFKGVVIPEGNATSFTLRGLAAGEYVCEIAAFDVNGLYSRFVAIPAKTIVTSPGQPVKVNVRQPMHDVIAACLAAAPNCRVAVSGEWQY